MVWLVIYSIVSSVFVVYMGWKCFEPNIVDDFPSRYYFNSLANDKLRHFEGDKREFIDNYGLEAYFDLLRSKEEPQRTEIPKFTKGDLVPPNIDNPTDNDRVGF